jgi:glycosyltransferase involved in cell wall biosynthesis
VRTVKLRILLINYRDIANPRAGGAEVHAHEIFRRIAGMGHSVHLLCAGFPGAGGGEDIDGVRILRRGREYSFNYHVQWFLARTPDTAYDVVIEDVNKIPVYSPVFTRTPVMLIIPHLFGTTVFQEASLPIGLYVYLWERFMPLVYRVPVIEVISESTKQDLVGRGFPAGRIHVVYCGIDEAVYHPDGHERYEPGYPYILSIGRLKKYKRIDLVLQAFLRLAGHHPDLRLLVAGEGDDAARLVALSGALGIADRVVFTGRVGEEEKVRLLRGARFAVNTSPKEGWGLTNIEAQACGIPVIASDSPGLRESVRHDETGLLVPHGDVDRLAGAMVRMLEDDGLRERLAAGALQWAKRFRWDDAARSTLLLIEKTRAERRNDW